MLLSWVLLNISFQCISALFFLFLHTSVYVSYNFRLCIHSFWPPPMIVRRLLPRERSGATKTWGAAGSCTWLLLAMAWPMRWAAQPSGWRVSGTFYETVSIVALIIFTRKFTDSVVTKHQWAVIHNSRLATTRPFSKQTRKGPYHKKSSFRLKCGQKGHHCHCHHYSSVLSGVAIYLLSIVPSQDLYKTNNARHQCQEALVVFTKLCGVEIFACVRNRCHFF